MAIEIKYFAVLGDVETSTIDNPYMMLRSGELEEYSTAKKPWTVSNEVVGRYLFRVSDPVDLHGSGPMLLVSMTKDEQRAVSDRWALTQNP